MTHFIMISERGKFLALDLGGTNFRVLIINLGDNHFDMQSKIYAIPNHIMTGTGVALFDHIAECLANFMKVGNWTLIQNFQWNFSDNFKQISHT